MKEVRMRYKTLEEVSGVGEIITIRQKEDHLAFDVGITEDEVSVSDGEQKYVIQLVRLAQNVACDGDPTRHVLRVAYYTQRTDGWFCLGSQYAPIVTPSELRILLEAVARKGWLNEEKC
jgi:hypothetical protein